MLEMYGNERSLEPNNLLQSILYNFPLFSREGRLYPLLLSPGLPTSRGITGFSVVCYGPIHLIRILYPLFDEEKLKMIYAKGGLGGIRPLVAQPLKLLKLLKR